MPYEVNLINLIERFNSETKCRAYLERLRWPDGVVCPRCEHKTISRLKDRGQFDCDGCRYQFSVTAGTIMHDTKLPLWKWFLAVYMMVESKKGISANQLKRSLDVSYRTAWYLCHRIRHALQSPGGLLAGIVEVDETYIGGKTKGKGRGYRGNKTMVMGAVQRDGMLRVAQGTTPDRKTLRAFISEHVSERVLAIYTDDNPSYGDMNTDRIYHDTVNHSADEWIKADVHTNTIESAWSLLERSIIGAFHKVSKKHLDLYLDEFEFRFNNRDNPYIFRDAMNLLLDSGNLEYQDLVA